MKDILITHDFINQEDIDKIIKFTNDNIGHFEEMVEKPRWTYKFGNDIAFGERSYIDLDKLCELKDMVVNTYWPKVLQLIKDKFQDDSKLYIASFWLAKQSNGSYIELHDDTDDQRNLHFKWSGSLYLNTMKKGGTLEFPKIPYSYSPIAGDLVLFPTQAKSTAIHEVIEVYEDRYTCMFWITEDINFALDA
jgi:hypothetical protein